jgi:hypothetical protein
MTEATSTLTRAVTSMFAVKKVPLPLLELVPGTYDFHLAGFASVVDTVSPDFDLKEFDVYFRYVLGLINQLKPVWNE